MPLKKITNASQTIRWIATLIVSVMVCLTAGCQKQGGSARAAEATKVLQSLKLISSHLAEYASLYNKFPDSLDVLQSDSTLKSIPLNYQGKIISPTRTKDYIVVYADPEYFRVVGIPVIWSDGTVETLAATYLASELEKQNRILDNHRSQKN